MTTKPWRFAWTGTQACLSAGILVVAEAWIMWDDVLASVSRPYGVPVLSCCSSCCARKPLQRIRIVVPSSSLTALSPGLKACTNLSQKSVSKTIEAAKNSHKKIFYPNVIGSQLHCQVDGPQEFQRLIICLSDVWWMSMFYSMGQRCMKDILSYELWSSSSVKSRQHPCQYI